MVYSKHFNHDGITIIFDKLEYSKEYPTRYVVTREGNTSSNVFIDKRPIEYKDKIEVSETLTIILFGYKEG